MRKLAWVMAAGLLALPSMAAAAKFYDIELAKQSYEAGKASGISPQTRGENRMCSAHWEVAKVLAEKEFIAADDRTALGDDFSDISLLLSSTHFLLAADEGIGAFSDPYKSALDSAFDKADGFISGDVAKTKSLFENLGVCQRS